MTGSPFLDLPAELRLRIYEYVLQFEAVLHRPLRASAWRDFTGYLADTSLLSACRQVHEETKSVFYELNTIKISYHHLCTCENRFPFPAFDEQHIRTLEVCNFLPRVDEPVTCHLCRRSGFGLFKHLQELPKLRSAKVAFEDIFSFTDFAPELLRILSQHHEIELSCEQVGEIKVTGLCLDLELQLPALHSAWLLLADHDDAKAARDRQPGQKTMQRALEYLQFEANTYDRTSSSLIPFFVPGEDDDTPVLRFTGLADEHKRRADFTIALAAVLNDIFADDGGSGSIDWVDLDGMFGGRWRFDEDGDPEHAILQQGPP